MKVFAPRTQSFLTLIFKFLTDKNIKLPQTWGHVPMKGQDSLLMKLKEVRIIPRRGVAETTPSWSS